MWNWDNGHMDDGWGFVMMIGMLGIWALVAVAIVWFIRATKAPAVAPTMPSGDTNADSASASVTQSAEQILADRLASGDIDPEDYRARLDALTSRGAP